MPGDHQLSDCTSNEIKRCGLTSSPDLLVINLLEFLGEVLAVRCAAIELQGFTSLSAVLDTLIELLEDGEVRLFKDGGPVERPATGCGRAGIVHVVHTVGRKTTCLTHESKCKISMNTHPFWPIKG